MFRGGILLQTSFEIKACLQVYNRLPRNGAILPRTYFFSIREAVPRRANINGYLQHPYRPPYAPCFLTSSASTAANSGCRFSNFAAAESKLSSAALLKCRVLVFGGFSGFGTSLTETDRIEASSPANCGNTDGTIIFKRDAAILFAAKRISLPSSMHAV